MLTSNKREVFRMDNAYERDLQEEQTEIDESEEQIEESTESTEGSEAEEDETYLTQPEVDNIVKKRLARLEKKIAKELGVSIKEAKDYISAGKSVSEASGLTPAQVRERLAAQRALQQQQGNQQGQYNTGDPALREEITEIRGILSDEREEKVRTEQKKEARKEFGELFDEYEDDIEEYAEDRGLTLTEAAAVVLHPKLRDHIEKRTQTRQQVKRKRKVEGMDGGTKTGKVDYESALSQKEKEVASKFFNMTPQEYYEHKKALGEID
jgi:hypothetical protein